MSKRNGSTLFSNGTEFMRWQEHNCCKCWKQYNGDDLDKFTCAIDRDIFLGMVDCDVSERTFDIVSKLDCPYRQEKRPVKKRVKADPYKNEQKLF